MRHNTLMATLLASASLLPSMQAHARGVTAVSPPDGYSFDEFFLRDVSADGRTFAGAGFTQGQPRTFFIFDVDGNVEDFQSTCLTCTFAFLTEMSSDGSAALIMGFTENPPFAPINSMEFWSDSTGLVSLDVPAGYVSLNGSELSADGSVVLLQASDHNSTGGGTLRDSFLWVPGQTNYQILTGVAGSDYQHIDGHHLSADGTSLIGQARRHPDSNTWTDQTATADSLGYYWNASTGGHYLEPTTGGLQGGYVVEPHAISADGSVVAGAQRDSTSPNQTPILWTPTSGTQELSFAALSSYQTASVYEMSDDGTVVIVTAEDRSNPDPMQTLAQSFLVTVGGSAVEIDGLAESHTQVRANRLSADGTVVVGESGIGMGPGSLFRWTQAGGAVEIEGIDGYHMVAFGMNEDGTVIIGDAMPGMDPITQMPANGPPISWVWGASLGSGSTSGTTINVDNTRNMVMSTFGAQSSAVARAHAISNSFTNLASPHSRPEIEVSSRGTGSTMSQGPILRLLGGGLSGEGGGHASYAGLAAEFQLNSGITAGLAFSTLHDNDLSDGFSLDGPLVTIGGYLTGQMEGSDLRWSLSVAAGQSDAVLQRSATAQNTEAGQGLAELDTMAASFNLYGTIPSDSSAQLSWNIGFTHASTTRGAYTETNQIAFPMTFAEMQSSVTTAHFGLGYSRPLASGWTVSAGGGIEVDLSRSDAALTGSSTIPGLQDFSISGDDVMNDARAYVSLGGARQVENGSVVSLTTSIRQSAFSDDLIGAMEIGYSMSF